MNKILFTICNALRRVYFYRRKKISLIIAFYLGLLLPVICIADIINLELELNAHRQSIDSEIIIANWSGKVLSEDAKRDFMQELGTKKYAYQIKAGCEAKNLGDGTFGLDGIDLNFDVYTPLTLDKGRMFDKQDVEQEKNVCLIHREKAEMNNLNIGDLVEISDIKYEIVGITDNINYENTLFIPATTFYKNTESDYAQQIIYISVENKKLSDTKTLINTFLTSQDKTVQINEVKSGQEFLDTAKSFSQYWIGVRIKLMILSVLFGSINIAMILIGNMTNYFRYSFLVQKALGATDFSLSMMLLIENIICGIIADVILLSTLPTILKVLGMETKLHYSLTYVGSVFGITCCMCIIVSIPILIYIRKRSISAGLRLEEENV